VLTDMFGGTPANVGLTMHQPGRVEVLTGANLPMLIKALQLCHTQVDLAMVAGQVRHSGARAITVASEVLCGSPTPIREKSA
jgi:PTS system mannose-specific IIA component